LFAAFRAGHVIVPAGAHAFATFFAASAPSLRASVDRRAP
jgi:hypothetical protein